MRMMLVLSLAALVFAGCTTSEPGPSNKGDQVLDDPKEYYSSHYCIINDVQPQAYAPDYSAPDIAANPWEEGDFWTYDITTDGESRRAKLIYYDDSDFINDVPQHYLVGSDSEQYSLEHALFSVNPMLGRIHRVLYSPHESGVHADMFAFPLCTGSTWKTTFFAREFSMSAQAGTVSIPGGTDAGFIITGTAGSGNQLRMEYSPSIKWFTKLSVTRDDGESIAMNLVGTGSDATGNAYFHRGQKDVHESLPFSGAASRTVLTTLELANKANSPAYDTQAFYFGAGDVTGRSTRVVVEDPNGSIVACLVLSSGDGSLSQGTQTCPQQGTNIRDGQMFVIPHQEGTFNVVLERGGALGQTSGTVEFYTASIYDLSGTV